MEKNIFRSVFRRENILQKTIFNFFWGIASYPRLSLEVFIRKNFGRRYFTIASAVTVAVILLLLPLVLYNADQFFSVIYGGSGLSFFERYATWYIFTGLFVFFCYKRSKETYTHSNVYDYNRFSLSPGVSLPFFYNLPIYKTRPTAFMVEVFVEPGFFFLIGLVLKSMGQPVGMLLMVSGICYALSYAASYKIQDDYFQDLIDITIMNEEIERSFVYGFEPDATRGVHFKRKPSSEDLRRKMAAQFFSDRETEDAEFTVL